jgi:hypothetical protein
MEDVLKANKEKAAAEKRERELLRQQREQEAQERLSGGSALGGGVGNTAGGASAPNSGNLAVALAGSSWAEIGIHHQASDFASLLASNSRGPPEPPKDRSTLATMRVIRRNLVYAVGMPPSIATEELLRKPEYFGQYGKIAKIVINRNHNPGDPRRASASAYVTFVHKVSNA